MVCQRVCLALLAVVAVAIAKPPPMKGGPPPWVMGKGASPWASFGAPPYPPPFASPYAPAYPAPYSPFGPGKSMYTRSLGPAVAPGMTTITVPYVPKTSPFFPKFVDPQAMIAKKTDMLANLFGGIGPVNYPAAGAGPWAFGPAKPFLYATSDAAPSKDANLQEILGEDKTKPGEVKRGIFGPKFGPPGAGFSPFASKFGPVPPKFGPFGPYAGFNAVGSTDDSVEESSRKKRAIVGVAPEAPKNVGPPPPYPGLSSIPEEDETDSGTPKQYLPGMFGPFGPFGPGPLVDPSIYMSKKTAFLNTLFNTLATSTPAPPGTVTDPLAPKSTIVPPSFWLPFSVPTEESVFEVTETPIPKSTIVPEDFWLPSSIIPGPTEYTDKVSTFLDKLFESLKLNKTLTASSGDDSMMPKTMVARSVDDLEKITTAKDAIVDSIMTELGSIKTDMFNTLTEMIAAQKAAAAAAAFAKPGKVAKPGKPLSPWAAMFAPPTVDPLLPFKQKMAMLSKVFDMLTGMQKNITQAIDETVKAASATEAPAPEPSFPGAVMTFNTTLLDAIKAKMDALNKEPMKPVVQPYPGFWGAYPGGYSASSAAKRNVNDEEYFDEKRQEKRGVKMTMHQGYQSMPRGAIESVQAGGGSVPGHQGGGIKLFESQQNDYEDWGKQWADWAQNFRNENEGRKHHHNHH